MADKGIGRALIRRVVDWCHSQEYASLTLTTYYDIPWNRPYYESLGFDVIEDAALRGTLKDMLEAERDGLSLHRVAMRMWV